MAIEQTFTQVLKAKTTKRITETMTTKVANEIGKAMVEIERARLIAGRDVFGNPFRALSPKYLAFKKRFTAGDTLTPKRKKVSKYMQKLLGRKIASYGAIKAGDKLRLTGELAADLNYRVGDITVSGTNPTATITLTVNSRSDLKAKGLLKMGFPFFGVSKVYTWQQKERNAIKKIVAEHSKGLLEAKF